MSTTRYAELLSSEFPKEKLRKRFAFLFETASFLLKERSLEEYCYVSEALLSELVPSYFVDIERLKQFHKINLVNPTKIAAYTAHWILKFRPIQLHPTAEKTEGELSGTLRTINAWYASYCLISMCYDTNKTIQVGSPSISFSELLEHLNYHMVYRSSNPQSLELFLMALRSYAPHPELLTAPDPD